MEGIVAVSVSGALAFIFPISRSSPGNFLQLDPMMRL